LVVSIGGNDALAEAKLLDAKVRSMTDALELMSKVRDKFRPAYARLLNQVLARQLPTAVCTIYEGAFQSLPSGDTLPRRSPRSTTSLHARLLPERLTALTCG
jgi:hypothetical protein